MEYNGIMSMLMVVMAILCIIGGLINFENAIVIAIFWVASSGFYIASSIYNLVGESKK